ncbi:hypothetical protein PHMEG_00029349 [Phytophthora megakarya]|uniref:DDE Tnp4 domain-containing protein n=1 Tax=Phytophthora megakarya TaxID=4795 RepID=A0A225V2T8_9STRA|nr:hypothetical protein PHMEG_00029349 [Phytophthora megakarya]
MEQPAGLFIIEDNAYPLSNSLLVPFNKLEIKSKAHSDYNFPKFSIVLVVDFVNVKKVIKTCMKLHKLCIYERTKNQNAARPLLLLITAYPKAGTNLVTTSPRLTSYVLMRLDVSSVTLS